MDTKEAKIVVVTRDETERKDCAGVLSLLKGLMSSPQVARAHSQGLTILFGGYDDDPRPIWEIPDIRQLVSVMNDQFPYWLFFMNCLLPNFAGFVRCMIPLNATQEERKSIIQEQLLRRWLVAFNEVSHYAGITEGEVQGLLKSSMRYLVEEVVIRT